MSRALQEEHPPPAPQLADVAFLVGRWRGEGWLGEPSYRYTKEVSGTWAAGGHHLVLEMTADYPPRDGRSDRHSALLVVSAGVETGSLVSRAYTDGGGQIEYKLERTADGFAFDDRAPHGAKAVRARKRLRPTPTGYEEILEIDRGEGEFTPYSEISLRRSEP